MGPLTPLAQAKTQAKELEDKWFEFPPLKVLNSPAGQAIAGLLPFLGLFKGAPADLTIDNKPVTSRLPAEFTPVGDEPPYERPTYPEPHQVGSRDGMRSPLNRDVGIRRRKTDGHLEDK